MQVKVRLGHSLSFPPISHYFFLLYLFVLMLCKKIMFIVISFMFMFFAVSLLVEVSFLPPHLILFVLYSYTLFFVLFLMQLVSSAGFILPDPQLVFTHPVSIIIMLCGLIHPCIHQSSVALSWEGVACSVSEEGVRSCFCQAKANRV